MKITEKIIFKKSTASTIKGPKKKKATINQGKKIAITISAGV